MQPRSTVARRFGKAVKELRLKKAMSQQQLADICGLDIPYIGQIERRQRHPTLGVMHGMASVPGVKMSERLRKAKL